jgi:hypothetical protein
MRGYLRTVAVAAITAGLVQTLSAAQSSPVLTRVRPLDARAEGLLVEAWHRSATVRDLITALNVSDLIVHVQTRSSRVEHRGVLRWGTCAKGARYVRLVIAAPALPDRQIPALAHELQHAVEVSRAPEVRDARKLADLFRRIGWNWDRGLYETEAALEIESRVRREIRVLR